MRHSDVIICSELSTILRLFAYNNKESTGKIHHSHSKTHFAPRTRRTIPAFYKTFPKQITWNLFHNHPFLLIFLPIFDTMVNQVKQAILSPFLPDVKMVNIKNDFHLNRKLFYYLWHILTLIKNELRSARSHSTRNSSKQFKSAACFCCVSISKRDFSDIKAQRVDKVAVAKGVKHLSKYVD